jgi:hypothetical protein
MVEANIIIFIIVGLLLSALPILSSLTAIFGHKKTYNVAPRKIWTYWDNPDKLPKAVKLCMDSWKKFNPDYEIVLLTKKNYQGYVTIPEDIRAHPHFNDSPQRFSDLVRLYVVEEHGGIWIDASVLIKDHFDNWLFPRYAEFSGFFMGPFSLDNRTPAIENWFFAANKGSTFIKLWKKEFLEMGTFKDIQGYLDSRKKMGVRFEKLRDPHYLAAYVAAQKVIQIDKYSQDTLVLRDSSDGPFKYLKDAVWYPEQGMKLACGNKKYQSPIMKMRSDEREILERELDYDLSNEKCGWLEAL